jgi:hypothetical protein
MNITIGAFGGTIYKLKKKNKPLHRPCRFTESNAEIGPRCELNLVDEEKEACASIRMPIVFAHGFQPNPSASTNARSHPRVVSKAYDVISDAIMIMMRGDPGNHPIPDAIAPWPPLIK